MKPPFFLCCLIAFGCCFQTNISAQQGVENTDSSNIVIHADPRLAMLIASISTPSSPRKNNSGNSGRRTGSTHSGKGFRVQLYNGNDRLKATQMKVDFLRRFPGVRAYMTYIQPQYRLKVGDFKTRREAQELYRQINGIYSPLMIVPDIVLIKETYDD